MTLEGLTDCAHDGSEKKLTGLSHQTGENKTKQLTENTEVQEKMKEKLEEVKESEISKKGKAAYDTVLNDESTKKVLLFGRCHD